MLEGSSGKQQLKAFITTSLIHIPDYPLDDHEPLVTGGLIDIAALEDLALFIEESFGVIIDAAELTTENIETVNDILDMLQSRMQ